jgi:tetratricopeptide (TPR) repeat protein
VPFAVKKLERAAEIAPDEPRVYFELGKAYSLNREYQKGYDAYQKVVKLDPGGQLGDQAKLAAQKIKHLL